MWILPVGRDVYHVGATPERVVGKNLHSKADSEVYSNIIFLYAMMCSFGQVVPSKETMFGILIFAGLGVARTSADNGEFINIGASRGPPRLNSYSVMIGSAR